MYATSTAVVGAGLVPARARGPAPLDKRHGRGQAPPRRLFQSFPRAFSLLELLVAVAILAIVVSVSVTVYTAYSLRAHRVNAQADLLRCAQGLERHATETMGYAMALDTDGDGVGDASTGPVSANLCAVAADVYEIRLHAANSRSFVLRATPRSGGAAATEGVLELDSIGVRRWDRNGDGDFDDAQEQQWTE